MGTAAEPERAAAAAAPAPSWMGGAGFLATKVRPSGAETPEICEYCSGDGEGKYRSDPKTRVFSSRTPKFDDDAPRPSEEYKTRIGPGSYERPKDDVCQRYGSSETKSDWTMAERGGHVVGHRTPAEEKAMPSSHFKIEDEDAQHWQHYKVSPNVAMSTRMGWGWQRAPKFASTDFQCDVGPGDYDAQSVKSDRRRYPDRGEASFVSQQTRFDSVRGDGRDPTKDTSQTGPGQYGVPKNPKFEWLKGAIDPATQRPYPRKADSSFARPSGIVPRKTRKERHGDPSRLSPGLYWSQSLQDMHSVTRPVSTQSTRGSSGFLASKRGDFFGNKRAAKEFAERPLSYFSMSKERIVWRTGGKTNAGMPAQTSHRFCDPGEQPRPATSSTFISRKRLEDAWAHEAEVSGRTVEEVVSDLWLKPIGDLSSIYDDLYAQEA